MKWYQESVIKLPLFVSAIVGIIVKISDYFLRMKPFSIALRYIFPGLALGAALGQSGVVTNAMINRSAEALVELISEEVQSLHQQNFGQYFSTNCSSWTQDLARRATFPEGFDIREISAHIAVRVIEQAISEGLKVRRIQIWTLDTIHSIHG